MRLTVQGYTRACNRSIVPESLDMQPVGGVIGFGQLDGAGGDGAAPSRLESGVGWAELPGLVSVPSGS